jgi:hypothetical protein
MNNMIAVNVRRLRLLVDKCKSSINGSFQRMGCLQFVGKTETVDLLADRIPQIRGNYPELREWSFRRCEVMTPQPQMPLCPLPQFAVPATPAPSLGTFIGPASQNPVESDWGKEKDDPFCLRPVFLDGYSWDF